MWYFNIKVMGKLNVLAFSRKGTVSSWIFLVKFPMLLYATFAASPYLLIEFPMHLYGA